MSILRKLKELNRVGEVGVEWCAICRDEKATRVARWSDRYMRICDQEKCLREVKGYFDGDHEYDKEEGFSVEEAK